MSINHDLISAELNNATEVTGLLDSSTTSELPLPKKLSVTLAKNVSSFLIAATGSASFTLNAWNLPTNVTGWLAQVLASFPTTVTSIYLATVTEIVGASMGIEAINNYISTVINIRRNPKEFVIRLGLLLFGISAMLSASLTAYLDIQDEEDSTKILKEAMLITSTLIYGTVYANSAYNLNKLKISFKGLRPLQNRLFNLADKIDNFSSDEIKQFFNETFGADGTVRNFNLDTSIENLIADFLKLPKLSRYDLIINYIKQSELEHPVGSQEKIKEILFWTMIFTTAGISASGGLIPTWLGMEKFYNNVIGQSYNEVSTVTRVASQGIPDAIAFLARASLYSNGIFHTVNHGWRFAKKTLQKNNSKNDLMFLIFGALTLVLISLPATSSNINTVQAGKLEDQEVVNNLLDYVVTPVTLLASTALFQVSIINIAMNIYGFFKHFKDNSVVNAPNNLTNAIREMANNITDYIKEAQPLEVLHSRP